ncbi:MAG: tyrosine-protein phosphatase [Victivallales bacterium]|nr:tyrosine-protein phosphatase [Victivallales bacterium]
MIELLSPANNASISTLTDVQKDFIRNRSFEKLRANDEELVDWLGLKQNMEGENSHPLSIEFKWTSDDKSRVNFVLQIATDRSFEHLVRQMLVRKQEISVFNLENGQQYYWRVFIEDTPHDDAEIRSFCTAMDTPRWIFIDGCTNVRDCGCWMTSSGRRIKQGLLYRGSEFNRHHAITPAGRYALVHDLHLKTDIDIRGVTEIHPGFVPPLDENGIQWINITVEPYGEIDKPEWRKQYFKYFTFLSNPDIYPAYCHCWGGADRTGTTSFLLGAILGMSDEDLILDYELTSCAIYGARKRNFKLFNDMLNVLDRYQGGSFAEKGTAYLREIGITEKTFDAIRDIFLQS